MSISDELRDVSANSSMPGPFPSGSGGSFGSALRSDKRLDLHLAEFHPAGVVFGAVGLDGEVARSKVLGEALRILVVDDLFAVEPDFNVWAESFDTEGIPLLGFAVFVFGIALVEPLTEVEPDWFVGRSSADVHLKAVAFLFQVVAQIDPAIVFSVLIDFEFQAEIEILKFFFGEKKTRAFGITILTAGENAVLVGPFGAAPGGPIVEGIGREEGEFFGMKKMGGKKENEEAEHGRDKTIRPEILDK